MPTFCKFIIINRNGFDDTLQCIESLISAGTLIEGIIVVDNGSSDGSVSRLKGTFGHDLQIIPNKSNLGYARALNIGIKTALTQEAEWTVLLNNDVVVSMDFLNRLNELALSRSAQNKIFSPLIFYYHDPDRIWEIGDRKITGTLLSRSLQKNTRVPRELEKFIPVDFITGCCMIVHEKAYSRIGFFDESYFMYAEDADFCLRANRAGYSIICATELKVWHKVASSAAKVPKSAIYWITRSQIQFYKKHLHITLWPLYILITLAMSLFNSSRKRNTNLNSGKMPAIYAWFDSWLNREYRYKA